MRGEERGGMGGKSGGGDQRHGGVGGTAGTTAAAAAVRIGGEEDPGTITSVSKRPTARRTVTAIHTVADARLLAAFENSEMEKREFDYSESVKILGIEVKKQEEETKNAIGESSKGGQKSASMSNRRSESEESAMADLRAEELIHVSNVGADAHKPSSVNVALKRQPTPKKVVVDEVAADEGAAGEGSAGEAVGSHTRGTSKFLGLMRRKSSRGKKVESFARSTRGRAIVSDELILTKTAPSRNIELDAPNVHAYLQKMQRGSLIQNFGCFLAVDEKTFKLVAFSENADKLLMLREITSTRRSFSGDQCLLGGSTASTSQANANNAAPGDELAPAWFKRIFRHKGKRGKGEKDNGMEGGAKHPRKLIRVSTASNQEPGNGSSNPDTFTHTPKLTGWTLFSRRFGFFSASSNTCSNPQGVTTANQNCSLPPTTDESAVPNKEQLVVSKKSHLATKYSSPFSTWKSVLSLFTWKPARDVDAAAVLVKVKEGRFNSHLEFGFDVRTLFTNESVLLLERACKAADVTIMNPILVQSAFNNRPFYAILHRTDSGLIMDFEPILHTDPVLTGPGALHSHKLASKAIDRLEKLPPGSISSLCEALVEEIRELTGYDRVMAYRFHPDEHGEIVAEAKGDHMESYLGLHYPATDIPQASRFMLMKNAVRVVADFKSPPVRVTHDESVMSEPISLATSTLRAVHGCHVKYMSNMGLSASLVLSVLIKTSDESDAHPSNPAGLGRRLWGIVVCHHETPRLIPYSLRLACEFLMQVFSLTVGREVETAKQMKENDMLRTQTLLCELLLREAPLGIVSQSPNIKDLLKCDGAALLYNGQLFPLGIVPSEPQIRKIIEWLEKDHGTSSGLSTDSLVEAGFPSAQELAGSVCGMIAVRLLADDFLFWFRAPVEKRVKWSGARNDPKEVDDPTRMGPRASFAAFLEVVKNRSEEWEDVDVDFAHSLQMTLSFRLSSRKAADISAMIKSRLSIEASRSSNVDHMARAETEVARILDSAPAPIFAVDKEGCITGWNLKMAEISGLPLGGALGKSLVQDLLNTESIETVKKALFLAIHGNDTQKMEVKLVKWSRSKQLSEFAILEVNTFARRGAGNEVVGVCFVGQDQTNLRAMEGKFTKLQGDYIAIVRNQNSLIPPIFAIDDFGWISEWNPAMEKLTNISESEAMEKMLIGGIFSAIRGPSTSAMPRLSCRMKADSLTKFQIVISKGLAGSNTERYPISFLDRLGNLVEGLLTVQARRDANGVIVGVFCFLQIASRELLSALSLQRVTEESAQAISKMVAYTRQETKGSLDGLEFAIGKMKAAAGEHDGKEEWVHRMDACERQMRRAVGDKDVAHLEEEYVTFEVESMDVGEVVEAVLVQGRAAGGKSVHVSGDVQIKALPHAAVVGDSLRLQQVLANLLVTCVKFTSPGGWVKLEVKSNWKDAKRESRMIEFEFRIKYVGSFPKWFFEEEKGGSKVGVDEEETCFRISLGILRAMGGDIEQCQLGGGSEIVVRLRLPRSP